MGGIEHMPKMKQAMNHKTLTVLTPPPRLQSEEFVHLHQWEHFYNPSSLVTHSNSNATRPIRMQQRQFQEGTMVQMQLYQTLYESYSLALKVHLLGGE